MFFKNRTMISDNSQAVSNTAINDTHNEPLLFLKNISSVESNIPKLPLYIQNIMAINGFDNVIAFANITDDHLLHMQEFARNDLLEIVAGNPTDKARYYGIFRNTPEKFQFLAGIKSTIFIIRDVCKSYVASTAKADQFQKNLHGASRAKVSKKANNNAEETPANDFSITLHEKSLKAERAENQKTVTCKNINSDGDLQNFLSDYFSKSGTDITKFEITRSSLPTLSLAKFPELGTLKHLNVTYSNVKSIPDHCFVHQSALVDLNLMYNKISELSCGVFCNLSTLKWLNLGYNKFETIPNGVFDPLKSLTHLNLESNEIATIESSAFERLESLKILNLKNNQIEALEKAIFKGLSSLTELYLSDNNLLSMDENIFENNSSLKKLDLENAGITVLPKLSHLVNLEILDISHNKIRTIKNDNFASLTKLLILKLNVNDVKEIEEDSFRDLESLYFLSLRSNKISGIYPNLFQNLVNLKILNLGFNQMVLHGFEFVSLKSLVSLNLDNNDFTTIKPSLLTHLESLQILSLAYLNLVRLESGIFSNMKNLRRLDLSGNCFEFPEEQVGWLDGLDNLEILSFLGCTVKKLVKFSREPLPSLKLLDVGYTNLCEVVPDFFDFYSSIEVVKIRSWEMLNNLMIQWMKTYPQILFKI